MGDPAGVGPELCLRALAEPEARQHGVPLVFGDGRVLDRVAAACGLAAPTRRLSLRDWIAGARVDVPAVVDVDAVDAPSVRPGEVQGACGRAAAAYIRAAVESAMSRKVQALVTAPIHKEALRMAGIRHPGHTEWLAELTGARRHCMMMASDRIVVSLATTHVALAEMPSRLTRRGIVDALELTAEALGHLRGRPPRLAVCALNPHAGEHGLLGTEEQEIIQPAIDEARGLGLDVEGPLPPDTAFVPARLARTDAYVVMYHDQGLIPFKMLSFEDGVNVTLGLPIVRTSVDHGTAFDIAWKGIASPRSLFAAIRWAVRLSGSGDGSAGANG